MWIDQPVVIKVIKKDSMDSVVAKIEFEIEIDILTRLSHRNIIRILGRGQQKGRIFIVLEQLQSVGLRMTNRTPFTSNRTILHHGLQICTQLADALNYLHQHVSGNAMILHRDLKIDNIGIGMDNNIKLFDFGLSKCIRKSVSSNEVFAMSGGTGTLRYMAPEVALNLPYNEKAGKFLVLVC